jgi:hypothetical protein
MITCKNCGQSVTANFCPDCGQKVTVGPISLKKFLTDLPGAVFHVHRGFFYNIIRMFRHPGTAIMDYLSGKRVQFFHPASFLVIALILNYIVVKVSDLHFYDDHELVSMDPVKAKAIMDYDGLQWWFLENTHIYILLSITVSSLFLSLIFRIMKLNLNIAETAVVVMFTIAQGVLIQTFIYACLGWVDSGPFLRTVESVNMSILILYATGVMYQLFTVRTGKAIRFSMAFVAGAGLAVLWIASAYVLYLLFGK